MGARSFAEIAHCREGVAMVELVERIDDSSNRSAGQRVAERELSVEQEAIVARRLATGPWLSGFLCQVIDRADYDAIFLRPSTGVRCRVFDPRRGAGQGRRLLWTRDQRRALAARTSESILTPGAFRGYEVGMTRSDIIARAPVRLVPGMTQELGVPLVTLRVLEARERVATLQLEHSRVSRIIIHSPRYRTRDWLRVGARARRVARLLGTPLRFHRREQGDCAVFAKLPRTLLCFSGRAPAWHQLVASNPRVRALVFE